MEISVSSVFDAAHRLPSHEGKCQYLHGHTWHVNVAFQGGEVDSKTGMCIDFNKVKRYLTEPTSALDHSCLLAEDDSLVEVLRRWGMRVITFKPAPTCEALAKWFYNELSTKHVVYRITLQEGEGGQCTLTKGEANE